VRSDLRGAARALALPTAALLAIAAFAPGRVTLGARIYVLILSAVIIVVLLRALRRAYPAEHVLHEQTARLPASARPTSLARIENDAALAVASSFELHYKLVPRLRALATGLLYSRRNVSLTAHPDLAATTLGGDAWELVRPDRPAPEDRLAKGIGTSELDRVVDALEAV
jgi:hypothetical protein